MAANNEESRVYVRWHETNTKVSRNNVSVKGLSQTGKKKLPITCIFIDCKTFFKFIFHCLAFYHFITYQATEEHCSILWS